MTRTIDPIRPGATSSPGTEPNRALQQEALTGPLTELVAPNPVDLSTPEIPKHSLGSVVARFGPNGSVTIGRTIMTLNIRNG
jgi:hypothetical protein